MKKFLRIPLLFALAGIIFSSCKKSQDDPKPATVSSPTYMNYLWVQQNVTNNDSISFRDDTIYFQYTNHQNNEPSSAVYLNQAIKGDFELTVPFKDFKGADGDFAIIFTDKFLFSAPVPEIKTALSVGVDASFSNIFPRYDGDTASLSLAYRSTDHGQMVVKRTGNVMEVSVSNPDAQGNPRWHKKTYSSIYTGDLFLSMAGGGKTVFNIKVAGITLKGSNDVIINIPIDPVKRGYWTL